jgi:GH43 family beta-xylosidase
MTEIGMRQPKLNGARTYQNPLPYADGQERTNPDPFAFQYRGRYYCVSTDERGVKGSWSDDLVLWHDAGYVLQIPGRSNYWAPCVTYAEGRFYLYYSCAPDDSTDPHDEHLMVASASRPLGPYEHQHTFFNTFSIDPHVVRGDDGMHYMFYSTNDPASADENLIGTSIFVDRLEAFDTLAGDPRPVVCPTLPEEMFEANRFGDGRDWYTVEGATYIRHRDLAFMTYSGNAYVRENYFVGYSRAKVDTSIDELEWRKFPSDTEHAPLIMRSLEVEGTGHNSIVVAPNLVDWWILYHGRDAADQLDPHCEQRTMRIDPLYFDGGRLDTPAPSSAIRTAPAAAQLSDRFADDAGSESIWADQVGAWSIGDGEARTFAATEHRLITADRVGPYRAQVWLAAASADPMAGARIGLVAYQDADEHVDVLLNITERTLVVEHTLRGVMAELGRVSVDVRDASAFRLLEVNREPLGLEIRIDDLTVLSVQCVLGDGAVGLVATGDAARFSAFALTEHVDLWGARLDAWGHFYAADAPVEYFPADALRGAGLAGADGPVTFTSHGDLEGATTVHDFEFAEGAGGQVTFSPHYVSDTDRVTLEVSDGTARLARVTPHGTTQISEIPGVAPNFSVRCVVSEGQLTLRVGSETVEAAVGPAAFVQRIRIDGARLCGVETSRSATKNQRKEER